MEANVFVSALGADGTELWRVPVPARAGYYYENVLTRELTVLRPAAGISPDGRVIAVIHSDIDGSDALSLVDVSTRELRTLRLRDPAPQFRFGASVADAKMLERRKAWFPRFDDDRYLYAVLHETRTDELGELSVLRIDTENGNIVARWPERHTNSTVRASMWDWTMTAGSVYVVAKDWSAHPYTLYRLEGRDLRPAARRLFDAAPLIRVLPLRGEG